MNLFKTISLAAVVAVSGFAANAATVTPVDNCSDWVSGSVTNTAGCDLGSTNNDFQNPLQVNIDEMFSANTWEFIAKDNVGGDDSGMIELLTIANGGWSIGESKTYEYYMLVLKGGASADPATYVGYLISPDQLSGEILRSPFSDGQQAISHYTLYGIGERMNEVPVPAAGFLLLAGLGGLAAMRRRK